MLSFLPFPRPSLCCSVVKGAPDDFELSDFSAAAQLILVIGAGLVIPLPPSQRAVVFCMVVPRLKRRSDH